MLCTNVRRVAVARLARLLLCVQLVVLLAGVAPMSSSSPSPWLVMRAHALRIDLTAGEQFAVTELVPPNTVLTFQFEALDRDYPISVLLVGANATGDAAATAAGVGQVGEDGAGGSLPLTSWPSKVEGVYDVTTRDRALVVTAVFASNTSTSVHFYLRSRINYDRVADEQAIDPIERNVRALTATMQHLQTLQARLRNQQRAHRATIENANARLLLWSMFQVIALLVMSGFQLYFLKRFLERKTYL